MQPPIAPPHAEELLRPLLASLPAASVSPQPPTALLPLLAPILRERVNYISSSATSPDPWLPLLCYDSSTASKLTKIVQNERFEPHPVSGEVEVDWDSEIRTSYKRLDEESLEALVTLRDLELAVKLTYCLKDDLGGGGGAGWRIGEVNCIDASSVVSWGGLPSISAAETAFRIANLDHSHASVGNTQKGHAAASGRLPTPDNDDADGDDDYWAQYDNTPAQTPAVKDNSGLGAKESSERAAGGTDEDSYFSQYSSVQPALDNHDPDEAQQHGDIETTLGREEVTTELRGQISSNRQSSNNSQLNLDEAWSEIPAARSASASAYHATAPAAGVDFGAVEHPRPSSSHGSSGSDTVARLEKAVEKGDDDDRDSSRSVQEVGVKQHIGTTIKSLYRLARVAGIEREEFKRIVNTEMEFLAMMDAEDE